MSTDDQLLATTDARVWAEAFCKRFAVVAVGGEPPLYDADDEIGLMIGWFANAIETGRTAGQNTSPSAEGDDE